ncbi:RHS repeat-associated core domain-containing protein [Luteimonas sp. A611]
MNVQKFIHRLLRLCSLLLVAVSLLPQVATAQTTVKYVHTDALGSVVAMTDATGAVVEGHREYEAYGQQLMPAMQDGPGYTGHVQDAATGLVYMQQRYYDPMLGIFLSTDPVTAYSNPVGQFHRYRYASNNPYTRVDPDGRRDIYIGGAADKRWTENVASYAETQKTTTGRDVQFFSYDEAEKISAAMNAPLAEGEPLNVIGHSLGAAEAISQANSSSVEITNLVTIDPVGASGDGSKPANVSNWTNVLAQPTAGAGNSSDAVAYLGRRMLGVTDTSGADVNKTSGAAHGDFRKMMGDAEAPQKIDSSYKK